MSCGRIVLQVWLVGWICSPAAFAQAPPRVFHETVSVAVDADAAKTLLTIEDRWRDGHWADALPDLIELTEAHGRSLILLERGNTSAHYVTVDAAADRLLATLSASQLQVYRDRLRPRVEALWQRWESSGDEQLLQRLTDQWFFSHRGDDACWELGQAAWWRGDLTMARYWWQHLLPAESPDAPRQIRHYPDTSYPRADVAARVILCQIGLNTADAHAEIDRFRELYPAAAGRLGEQFGLWADLLQAAWQRRTDPQQDETPHRVSTFAGSNQRTLQGPREIDLGGELWSEPLTAAMLPRPLNQLVFPPPAPLPYYPAVVDDRVYLNDGQRLLGWELFTGRPLNDLGPETSPVLYPPLSPEPALPPRRNVVGGPLWTVTVGNGRLFARMGSVVTTPAPSELREQASELVCLDLAEGQGRLLWKLTAVDISSQLQADDPAAPSWSWEGTPLLDGSRLYAALSRRRPQLEWGIVCLDAETGRLLWQQTAGISRTAPADHENLASHLLLTAGQNRLFLSTDWGAIFCLSQHDGRPLWVTTYHSAPPNLPINLPRPPVTPVPPLLVGQQLFIAPGDSPWVACFDVTSGSLLWQKEMREPVEFLLGVSHGHLIGSGQALWGLDQHTGEPSWRIQHDEPERHGYGRGWLAGDLVYWPTRESICVVETATGRMTREQSLRTPDEYRFGGHLVGYDGVLLVASSERLTAYGEYSRLRDQATDWLSAHPQDIRTWLKRGDFHHGLGADEAARADWLVARESADPLREPELFDDADRRLARDRWAAAAGRPLREQFAQATSRVQSPRVLYEFLAAEWQQARQVEHRQAVLERWLQHAAREPPVKSVGLTTSLARATLAHLTPSSASALPSGTVTVSAVASHAVLPTSKQSTEFWRRAWQRELLSQESVIIPQPSYHDSSLVLMQSPGELAALDTITGAVRWTLPYGDRITSACEDDQQLWLTGPAEIAVVSSRTGTLQWRVAYPGQASTSTRKSVRILHQRVSSGWLVGSPEQGFWCLDAATGDIRWEVELRPEPWGDCVTVTGQSLLGQSALTARVEVIDLDDGHRRRWPLNGMPPWLRDPVPSASGEQFGLVTADREVWLVNRHGQLEQRYLDIGSYAHADPWLQPLDGEWAVLVDGLRVRSLTTSGVMSDQLTIALQPLHASPPVTILADDLWLACSAGMLRAFQPRERRILWEHPLLTGQSGNVIRVGSTDIVLVVPNSDGINQRADRPLLLEVWNARQGQRRQAIAWPNPSGRLQVSSSAGVLLLADQRRICAYVPRH